MKPKLSNKDFCRSSKKLRCEVPAIKAVAEVESLGNGFYPDDFPVILFERHIFRKYTQGRYNKSHPHLSGALGGYGKAGQNQRNKFNEAFALNPDAAMKACSWGKFQIMGFNHAICGYATVGEFVDAMKESEGKQLDAFVSFVIANNLAIHLRNLNWAAFAKGYNGAGYAKNRYDKKMATAYTKYVRENINCNQLSGEDNNQTAANAVTAPVADLPKTTDELTETSSPDATQIEQTIVEEVDGTLVSTTTVDAGTVTVTSPEPYQGIGFIAVIKRDVAAIGGGNLTFQGLSEYAQQASGWPEWLVAILTKLALVALGLSVLWVVYRLVHYAVDSWKKAKKVDIEAAANTDKNRFNIEWS